MRISDWSSDVCSSDLRSGSCRLALAGGQSRDLQEIGEHRVAVLGRDAFGMELDAVDRQLGVAETHHRAVVARRVDHEPLGNVDHLEAVVARRLNGRGEPRVDRKGVVSGKRVSVRVDLGGRRYIQKKKKKKKYANNK